MLFNSVDFILFFPVVTILFFLLPKRVRNLFLLAASLYFYMCWKAKYILLMGFSILVTYLAALLMAFFEKRGKTSCAAGCWPGRSSRTSRYSSFLNTTISLWKISRRSPRTGCCCRCSTTRCRWESAFTPFNARLCD